MERRFSLTVNEKKQTVVMTMGMLHELSGIVGHVELLPEATGYNTELRSEMLVAMLSTRDEEGEIVKELNLRTLDADPDEILELLAWATGHVTAFLLKAVANATKNNEQNVAKLLESTPTNGGSKT